MRLNNSKTVITGLLGVTEIISAVFALSSSALAFVQSGSHHSSNRVDITVAQSNSSDSSDAGDSDNSYGSPAIPANRLPYNLDRPSTGPGNLAHPYGIDEDRINQSDTNNQPDTNDSGRGRGQGGMDNTTSQPDE